jgi:hypothetical protein
MDNVRKPDPMKRFDLLRSPLLLLAVGVLLLNDFVLKAAFHNWITGKLSDVAGLAAFTIFCCALWPRRVRAVGAVITILFVFWKSPYASGAIEAANAVLPFAIGRTVDITDLMALPVVWLVCGNTHRLPLVDLGKIGTWLTAGVCLFAFTATSSIAPHYTLTGTALVPGAEPGSEAALSELFDQIASRHGLPCDRCKPLSEGRIYRGRGPLQIEVGFDALHNRLLFSVSVFGAPEAEVDKAHPEADQLKAEIEQGLKQRFPAVSVSDRYDHGKTAVVRIFLPPVDEQFEQAFAVVDDVLRRAGFKLYKPLKPDDMHTGESLDRVRVTALLVLPALSSRATRCRDDGTFAVSIYAQTSDFAATQQRIVGDLRSALARAFDAKRVSADDDARLCR